MKFLPYEYRELEPPAGMRESELPQGGGLRWVA